MTGDEPNTITLMGNNGPTVTPPPVIPAASGGTITVTPSTTTPAVPQSTVVADMARIIPEAPLQFQPTVQLPTLSPTFSGSGALPTINPTGYVPAPFVMPALSPAPATSSISPGLTNELLPVLPEAALLLPTIETARQVEAVRPEFLGESFFTPEVVNPTARSQLDQVLEDLKDPEVDVSTRVTLQQSQQLLAKTVQDSDQLQAMWGHALSAAYPEGGAPAHINEVDARDFAERSLSANGVPKPTDAVGLAVYEEATRDYYRSVDDAVKNPQNARALLNDLPKTAEDVRGAYNAQVVSVMGAGLEGPLLQEGVTTESLKGMRDINRYVGQLTELSAFADRLAPKDAAVLRNNLLVAKDYQSGNVDRAAARSLLRTDVSGVLAGSTVEPTYDRLISGGRVGADEIDSLIASQPYVVAASNRLNRVLDDPQSTVTDYREASQQYTKAVERALPTVAKMDAPASDGFAGTFKNPKIDPQYDTWNWTALLSAGALSAALYQPFAQQKALEQQRDWKREDDELDYQRRLEMMAINQGYALDRIDASAAAEDAGKGTPSGSVVSSNAKKGKSSI